MSRLLDRLKNADRKRRELRARRSDAADSVVGQPGKLAPELPARITSAGKDRTKARTGAAVSDETYWAEVKKRLGAEGSDGGKARPGQDDQFWSEVKQRLAAAAYGAAAGMMSAR